jgi:hypothetical protein
MHFYSTGTGTRTSRRLDGLFTNTGTLTKLCFRRFILDPPMISHQQVVNEELHFHNISSWVSFGHWPHCQM